MTQSSLGDYSSSHQSFEASRWYGRARALAALQQHPLALSAARHGLELMGEPKDLRGRMDGLEVLAEIHRGQHQEKQAKTHLEEALELAVQVDDLAAQERIPKGLKGLSQ